MTGGPAPYVLHGFEASYFTAKVRPALRYKQLFVVERHANYPEIIRRTGLAFIPIVVTPEDETWQDSTDIYRRLEERHPDPPLYPTTALQRLVAQLIELCCDEFLLIPAMHYRWGSELGEASARARFSAMVGSVEAGNKAGDRMAMARFAVGATVEAGPAIEAHMTDLLDALSTHFEAHPFLLGERQSIADCALMGPFDGHFFTDLVSRRLLLERAIPVVGWIERCRHPDAAGQGDWLADDALAPTLVEVLRVLGRDAVPIILDSVRAVEAWADSRESDTEIPRAVGAVETSLRGKPVTRAAMPYALYGLQHVSDLVRALSEADRAQAESALAGTGFEALIGYEPRHRLGKEGFALVFEPS